MLAVKSTEEMIYNWFHYFHENPEVSWKEINTTEKLSQILDDLQVSYSRFEGVTGLVAEIGEGEKVIAVRADIDALWQEVDG